MIDARNELHYANIIVWHDGTFRPQRGHIDCDGYWRYDGQFYIFQCTCRSRK